MRKVSSMIKRCNILATISAALCAVLMAVSLPACDGIIYDDLDPCPHGVRLRFVYDHNMEFVNSFYKQADCLSLYVFDAEGNFVTKQVETTENLKKPDYAMQLDLERGNYRFLAYAGLECPEHSFSVVNEPQAGRTPNEDTAMQVAMDEGKWGTSLHDLFYGSLNTTVEGDYYVDDTLFTFTITDDNTLMDHENNLIPNGTVNYTPWAQGTLAAGTTETGEQEAKVAYAEFSTGRLVTRTHQTPRLVVMNKETGNKVIDIPLINYLLLLKSERYATMGAQEFLDRESDWSLIFFLNEEGNWLRTHIVVNDWIVRLNDMEL